MLERRDPEYLTQEQAEQLWRRAAELQAEAESVAPLAERALPAGQAIRLPDVETAAVEAGIAPEFLHLARAEAQAWEGQRLGPRADRAATMLLNSETRALRATRWFPEPPARILELIGRVYPAAPFHMTLKDITGDDPANGAVLIYTPSWTSYQTSFTLAMFYADLAQVLVSVTPADRGDQAGSNVVVVGSLERSRTLNLAIGGSLSGILGGAGGLGGFAIAAGVAGLPLLAAALPGALAAAAVGGGFAGLCRVAYRWGLRKGQAGLEDLLRAIDVQLRTRGVIPQPEPPAPKPRSDVSGSF